MACGGFSFKCAIKVVVLTIFFVVFDMLVHGNLLMADYKAIPNLWRPDAEMMAMMPYWTIWYFALAMVLAMIFKKYKCTCGICEKSCSTENAGSCKGKTSICMGVMLGIILGLMSFSPYMFLPVPLELGIKWFFSGLFMGIGAGVIMHFLNGKCCGGSSCCSKPQG